MKENIKFVYFVSLGCAKNFVDTEVMAASLLKNNLGITEDLEEASIVVINTCAFIPPAREEAEEHIKSFLDWKNEGAQTRKLIISGCLTQYDKDGTYSKKYPEIDLWLGISEITSLPERISSLYNNDIKDKIKCNTETDFIYDEKTPRLQLTPHHYAYAKISDGCNNNCSYCSIPAIRGSLRSRSQKSVVDEVKNLVVNGAKEIIIIGQDITAFSKDKKEERTTLASLVKEIDQKVEGDYWIRLHYLHPDGITDDLIEVIKNSKHTIPYLDIPLQHISDKILKGMNRRISKEEIINKLTKLKNNIKNIIIRTTFLVGFPGESELEFDELKEFVKKWKFDRLGVFPFYPEPNTKAFSMKEQVPHEIAEKRAKEIQKIHKKNSLIFNNSLIGKEIDVIIDSVNSGVSIGRSYMDSPEIDNIVKINKNLKAGNFYRIKIKSAGAFELLGEVVGDKR